MILLLSQTKSIKNSQKEVLKCYECNSTEFDDSSIGYVCKCCGIVLLAPRLVYNTPYRECDIQYEKLNNHTKIGNQIDRKNSGKSHIYNKFSKIQSLESNEKNMRQNAKIEIKRIFTTLCLPSSYKEIVFEKYEKIRKSLKPRSKYRSPEKLSPIVIYLCLKAHNISVNQDKILRVSNINKKDFNAFILMFSKRYPEYINRNRKEYVKQKILEVSEKFDLGMQFVHSTLKLLDKMWDIVKLSKDDMITSLISSVIVLCKYKEKVSINKICSYLGVKMSSIQSQVKNNIFRKFKVDGFTSLVKSSGLMKDFLIKMKWIEGNSKPIILNIKLGNSKSIFNSNNNLEYYLYILSSQRNSTVIVTPIKNNLLKENLEKNTKNRNLGSIIKYLKLIKLFPINGKDPPLK